jgi:hypothetical protein
MVHDEMVIQLMVDRSSSNMEAGNIAKIDANSALICGGSDNVVCRRRLNSACGWHQPPRRHHRQ